VCGGIPPHTQRRDREERLHKTLAVVLRALAPSVQSRPAGVFSSHVHTGTRKCATSVQLPPVASACNQMKVRVWWRRGLAYVSGDFSVLWVGDVATATQPQPVRRRRQVRWPKGCARQAQLSCTLRKAKKKIVAWTWVERGVSRRASRAKHKIERRCGVGCHPAWLRQRCHEWEGRQRTHLPTTTSCKTCPEQDDKLAKRGQSSALELSSRDEQHGEHPSPRCGRCSCGHDSAGTHVTTSWSFRKARHCGTQGWMRAGVHAWRRRLQRFVSSGASSLTPLCWPET
jgi:hypothetical protein